MDGPLLQTQGGNKEPIDEGIDDEIEDSHPRKREEAKQEQLKGQGQQYLSLFQSACLIYAKSIYLASCQGKDIEEKKQDPKDEKKRRHEFHRRREHIGKQNGLLDEIDFVADDIDVFGILECLFKVLVVPCLEVMAEGGISPDLPIEVLGKAKEDSVIARLLLIGSQKKGISS